jgi:hypothetical protein
MSRIRENKITNKAGTGAVELEKGAHLPTGIGITGAGSINVSGVITATSFSGSGAGLTGIDATSIKDPAGNVKIQAQASGAVYTGIHTFTTLTATTLNPTTVNATTLNAASGSFTGNVSIGGTLTYEDVVNVDSVGVVTAGAGLRVTGGTSYFAGAIAAAGAITGTASTATTITVASDTTDTLCFPIFTNTGVGNNAPKVNTSRLSFNSSSGQLTATSFSGSGANLTSLPAGQLTGSLPAIDGSALTGIDVGLSTEALTTAGGTVTLDLTKDDHKITKSGTYTITCTGGSEGGSHSLRIENSGTSSVSFSSYFKFPSGGTPSLPTTNGAISLISFTVHKAGSVGVNTVLLAGASVNYS